MMCYYVLIVVLALTTYTLSFTTDGEIFQTYFACLSAGLQLDRDCGQSPEVRSQEFSTLASVTRIAVALLPGIIIIFTMNCTCKGKCCKSVKDQHIPQGA